MRVAILIPWVFLVGCAHSSPAPTPASLASQDSAVEFVRSLSAAVANGDSDATTRAIDRAFGERLPSGVPLDSLFRAPPPGCTPSYAEGPGYGAIAIPPPMVDDDAAETARIEAIIDELQASTEVVVTCAPLADDGDDASFTALYAVALRRGDDGSFLVMAWRDFRGERSNE